MKRKSGINWISILVLTLTLTVLPTETTKADTGPKPSMSFSFVYKITGSPQIASGLLLECSDPTCTSSEPLPRLGPQNFACGPTSCSSLAYRYSSYHRLMIEFSDGVTRTSNVFIKTKFAADFRVSVYQDYLEVVELPGGATFPITGILTLDLGVGISLLCLTLSIITVMVILLVRAGKTDSTWKNLRGWYIAAWVLAVPTLLVGILLSRGLLPTLILELGLGVVYVMWRKRPVLLVLTVILLENLLTQPALWLTSSGFSGHYPVSLVLFAELVVWLVEAGILFAALRNRIKFREALWVSLALNAASFGVGLLLPF